MQGHKSRRPNLDLQFWRNVARQIYRSCKHHEQLQISTGRTGSKRSNGPACSLPRGERPACDAGVSRAGGIPDEYNLQHKRDSLANVEVVAYANFLESRGTRLEDALEWTYKVYFVEEYSIRGFTLALPSRGASWLDKCKSIGPEIERAAKSYSTYSRIGNIDGEYFPYESFKSFGDSTRSLRKSMQSGEPVLRGGDSTCSPTSAC